MPIDPRLIDVFPDEHDGYTEQFAAEDTVDNLRSMGARDFPRNLWIEPSDWADAARDCDKYHTWPEDYSNRFSNQQPTHECTCHSLMQQFEVAWNRQRKSNGQPLFVSVLSIYAEANPRIRGGANIQTVLRICQERGFLPEYAGPNGLDEQKKRFRHTIVGTQGKGNSLQSHGDWVPVRSFPEGWRDTGRHLRALEAINIEQWEQMVCLVLHGIAVGVGRKGHAIPYVKWEVSDDVMKYKDSYDRFLYDSVRTMKGSVGGAHGIYTIVQPDDYNFPVGSENLSFGV